MPSWSAREEGTLKWLRNHRRGLRYVLEQAVTELERARAAASAAEDQLRDCAKADVAFAVADTRLARERLDRAERNVEWQNDKIMLLNARGIIKLDNLDQHREMSAEEVQWNRDLDAEKPLLQVTVRSAASAQTQAADAVIPALNLPAASAPACGRLRIANARSPEDAAARDCHAKHDQRSRQRLCRPPGLLRQRPC